MNKMISMYDPSVDAFREFPLDKAKKFVESAKEVEKQIADIQKNIDKEIKELQDLKEETLEDEVQKGETNDVE